MINIDINKLESILNRLESVLDNLNTINCDSNTSPHIMIVENYYEIHNMTNKSHNIKRSRISDSEIAPSNGPHMEDLKDINDMNIKKVSGDDKSQKDATYDKSQKDINNDKSQKDVGNIKLKSSISGGSKCKSPYPSVTFKHKNYIYNSERETKFTKRVTENIRRLFRVYLSNRYFSLESYPSFALMCYDILTFLGGNRYENNSYTKPQILTKIDNELVELIFKRYNNDFRYSFEIHKQPIPNDDELKGMINDILDAYIRFMNNGKPLYSFRNELPSDDSDFATKSDFTNDDSCNIM